MSNPIAIAESILGTDFLGPKAYWATFGQLPVDAPTLHLTEKEIQRIRDRGEQLVLMQSHFARGVPMTMQKAYQKNLKGSDGQADPYVAWYANELFCTTHTPNLRWCVVSKTPIGVGKNYFAQTEDLKDYLQVRQWRGGMPTAYQNAMDEVHGIRASIEREKDFKKKSEALVGLQINRLLRFSAIETLLWGILQVKQIPIPDCASLWNWTSSMAHDGRLIGAGYIENQGAYVSGFAPQFQLSYVGVYPAHTVV